MSMRLLMSAQMAGGTSNARNLLWCTYNQLILPRFSVPGLLHAAHVLLTLLNFRDNAFQIMLAQVQAPQQGSMIDTMVQANALLSQSKVNAHASEYGTTMNQLVAGLGELALAWT
ncbi:uncharacterized protein MYCFIDRAFT_182097 [Pseudocercospora fijiensis CIRAD86]|uniref:Uncharacterized protein n=1 Tax=Pseudocercospora fijiensis (strain CIRAD86) TaxID=383855 RepID=M2ZAL9_PSEFD|nr:uncharacterized protein MYCFIDRAFT_182097 [Pseudocercospora fijiensis CIRAD86]EME86865.1 hypothetical protein MYCFIDRAFT_182097 [Pseudocercospora fijiensis CIRAD86]